MFSTAFFLRLLVSVVGLFVLPYMAVVSYVSLFPAAALLWLACLAIVGYGLFKSLLIDLWEGK